MEQISKITHEPLFITPQQTMETVMEAIREVIPYELAVILSREEGNQLKVRYAAGPLKTENLLNFQLALQQRPDINKVLETGEVTLTAESDEEKHRDTYDGILDLPDGHSCMLAPLRINGKVLGLMTLDHRECNIFTPERVSIAGILSRIIALALAQALAADNLITINQALLQERVQILGNSVSALKNLMGNSPDWLKVLEKIKLAAPAETNVMILGETGTGKELVSRALHNLSKRAEKPFIALNCSALNSNLAESELFGHEKGAFTGAVNQKRGRFELADKGTLFLDEVGDLPQEIQPKLLRAIQEGEFERVGGEMTIKSDVRIICATHINLEERVAEGKFREDLYYRLNVFPVILPPLRKRKEDIGILSKHFLSRLSDKFDGRTFFLTDSALKRLHEHHWPGNVRELQNTLERGAVLSSDGVIRHEMLIFENHLNIISDFTGSDNEESIGDFDSEVKKIIEKALKKTGGKIYGSNGAAEILGLKPTTLISKMDKLKIRR